MLVVFLVPAGRYAYRLYELTLCPSPFTCELPAGGATAACWPGCWRCRWPVPPPRPPPSTDYLAPLKTRNLSYLWHADRLVFYGTKSSDVFPEPLGFIGANYQRFYLHYGSVRPPPPPPPRLPGGG